MNEDHPFDELPESLVEEMLNKCDSLSKSLSNSFEKLYNKKKEIKEELKNRNLLKKDSEFSNIPSYPTSCGIDGSYTIEKLLAIDMIAFASVAVEGLTPPTEKRHWPKPHHFSDVLSCPHSDSTTVVARAIMMCMELELAAKAPHDVVFLDGSLTTPIIYLNQALNKLDQVSPNLSSKLTERLKNGLNSYNEILQSKRTDKIYIGIPKYTTRKEITDSILNLKEYEDRGTLSFVLDSGDIVGPVKIQNPQQPWHLDKAPIYLKNTFDEIIEALNDLRIAYYRPYSHIPALRIEMSSSIATNDKRLSVLFEALKLQCGAMGIMEPYPLYLADRMVKHLRTAVPAIRRTTTQEISLKWEEDLGNMYLAMHGYRTEGNY